MANYTSPAAASFVGGLTSGAAKTNNISNNAAVASGAVSSARIAPLQAPAYKPPTQSTTGTDPNFDAFMKQQEAGLNQAASIEKQIQAEIQAQKPAVAPTINLNAIQAAANKAANKQVNPLYTQQLNEYIQNEAAAKTEQQKQNELNIQGYQSSLANTLAQNTQAEQFAGQQNEMTQGNVNAQASNYQLSSGNAENAKITALQSAQGSGGLAGSGMGAQQLWEAENQKNVEDAQQQGGFQYNRDVANLATSNTFAQLAQSSDFSKTQEGQQEATSKFSLNSYLRQASHSQQQYQNALAAWKQQAIGAAQQNSIASQVSNQLQAYRGNAGVYQAGVQAYSPQLNTTSAPSMVNQLSYQP